MNTPVNASNIEPGGFNSSTPEDKPKVETTTPIPTSTSPTIYTANFEGVKPNTAVTGVAT